MAKEVKDDAGKPSKNFSLFGQESNGSTWALCRMNMFLHEQDAARIEWCDTINNPKLVEDDKLMKFNVVVANPPFSLDKWGADFAGHDPHRRFWRGIPPKSKGDYAFITHMIEIGPGDDGRVGVIVPHGVLFRGGSEGLIRQKLIEENLLEAVIGLPANLFFGTGIPAAILIFHKGQQDHGRALHRRQPRVRGRQEAEPAPARGHREDRRRRSRSSRACRSTPIGPSERDRGERVQPEHPAATWIPPRRRMRSTSQHCRLEIEGLEAELAETRKEMKHLLAELGVV